MRKCYTVILSALASILFTTTYAFSSSPVYFKSPIKFRGTGCPGFNSITVPEDNKDTVTILFDQFDAARPKDNATSGTMRTSCSFVIPVHVPQGLQVSTMTATWKGYAEGRTKLRREYFFAGQRGPRADDSPKGDFTVRDNLMHGTAVWGKCGTDVPMRVNVAIRAESNPSYIAIKNMMSLKLTWRKCADN